MPNWHGQQQEDSLLWHLLTAKHEHLLPGTFVDVGAHDGVKFSNTLVFEDMGWRGLCVEPNPKSYEQLRANRSCACVSILIGDHEAPSTDFYVTDEGMLSSAMADYRERYEGYYGQPAFEGWHRITKPMLTLDNLIGIYTQVETKDKLTLPINIVSIDTEGYETQVMAGFDPRKWQVEFIVLEITFDEHAPEIRRHLNSIGYHQIAKLSSNYFFSTNPEDARWAEQWKPEA